MLNLGVIEPGSYFMDGSYAISETSIAMPLQAHFKVELMPNVLEIEGAWQQHSGRPSHGFKLQMVRDHTSQSQADVVATGEFLGTVKGRASLTAPTYQIIATEETNSQRLSVQLIPSEQFGVFAISGFLSVANTYYPFHGRVIPTEGRAALSNVVSLVGRVA